MPYDARFLGPEKNRVAQKLCNLSYLVECMQGQGRKGVINSSKKRTKAIRL